jgi:hypothetical protein
MALVKGPLMSLDASGSIGDAITFSKWKGRNYVRELVRPSNPNSALQICMRAGLRFITQIWGSQSATVKGRWEAIGANDAITGLNAMLRANQIRLRQGFGIYRDPQDIGTTVDAAPAAPSATAAQHAINLAWTDSVTGTNWGTVVYALNGAAPSIGPEHIIRILPKGTSIFSHYPLVTGDTWHYKVSGLDEDGQLGTPSADFDATVS